MVVGFRATHRLVGDFGRATEPHPHDYQVRASVRGDALRDDGTLCDMGWLRQVVDAALAPLEGRDLNDVEPFTERNPTAEVLADHLYQTLAPSIDELLELSIEVWESPEAYARYEGARGSIGAGARASSSGR